MTQGVRWTRGAAVVLVCALAAGALATEPGLKAGDKAKDFTLKMANTDEKKVQLSALRGKYVLLVMVRQGCSLGEEDLPTVNEGYKRLAGDKFFVLGIVSRADRSDVRKIVEVHGIVFPIGCDERGEILDSYGVEAVPTSFLIDPKGVILSWSHGTAAQFSEVEKLIGKPAEPSEADAEAEPGGGESAAKLLSEAFAYYRAGELKKSYVRCRQTLKLEPTNARAWLLLGDIYARAGKPDEAVAVYRRALEHINVDEVGAVATTYNRMARTYTSHQKYKEAAGVYATALQVIYEDGGKYTLQFYADLGTCHGMLGKRKEALAAFEEFFQKFKLADSDVQKRYAKLYRRVEEQQAQIKKAAAGGSTER